MGSSVRAQVEMLFLLGLGLLILGLIVYYMLFISPSIVPPSFIIKPVKVKSCVNDYVEYQLVLTNPNDVKVELKISIGKVDGVKIYVDGKPCSGCVTKIIIPPKGQKIVTLKILSEKAGRYIIEGTLTFGNQVIGKFAIPSLFSNC